MSLQEPESEYAQPRVSPYRLAAHLTSAFVIYSGLFWTALSVAMPEPPAAANVAMLEASRKVRKLALPVAALVSVTAVSGAFVAGNDAVSPHNCLPHPLALCFLFSVLVVCFVFYVLYFMFYVLYFMF